MSGHYKDILKERLPKDSYKKLMAIKSEKVHRFVADAITLCNPQSVFVCTDSPEDIACIRRRAIELGEEKSLATEGHTYHFDGPNDQGRDKEQTKYLLPKGMTLGEELNTIDKEDGQAEIRGLLKDSMLRREMLVRFFSLGPINSRFSISAVQITDSAYVGHSEDILYRPGYEQFIRIGDSPDFFRVLHSSGELENFVSKNCGKKRIYIDIEDEIVYSVNTQYAGNTVGFKKLSLRLAIRKALREGWLAEHMFIMGVHGPGGRTTYFTGAFPSFCGKTSTAMVVGETIIGDDLAYLRCIEGEVRTVNVECGVFGIIQDVNPTDDPLIIKALTSPGEVIFSNILVKDGIPYWTGDGKKHPESGINFTGEWFKGKKDASGAEVPASHKNARYTIRLSALPNLDPRADDPVGVPVGGIIYGGRDSDTWVPVQESFNWRHGVVTMGASLESETTAATLGKEGVRAFQPMSNLDFLSIPIGIYINQHLQFAMSLPHPPIIFAVNYFLKGKDGGYLNDKKDKYVWLKWMERRVHGEMGAIETPTGLIPIYEDLVVLFRQVLGREYTKGQYELQFTIRIPENMRKIERVESVFRKDATTPGLFFDIMEEQRKRLIMARERYGDYVSPFALASNVDRKQMLGNRTFGII
jgi:phosphoenolpyruvate carboxykinase (GTP)